MLPVCVKWCLRFLGSESEGVQEVESKPAKAKAKPTKKPVLPDSVRAVQKVPQLTDAS